MVEESEKRNGEIKHSLSVRRMDKIHEIDIGDLPFNIPDDLLRNLVGNY